MRQQAKRFAGTASIVVALWCAACKNGVTHSEFVAVRWDRQITSTTTFPVAIDPSRVGTYPPDAKSGAGYFYDDLLEYRVWSHPEKGAPPLNGTKDYFAAFAQYERAKDYSDKSPGSEPPLALVRQLEWIGEPTHGTFIPEKGERITEWQVEWLNGTKRTKSSIEEFLKHPKEGGPNE